MGKKAEGDIWGVQARNRFLKKKLESYFGFYSNPFIVGCVVSPYTYVEVLTPRCDHVWRKGL